MRGDLNPVQIFESQSANVVALRDEISDVKFGGKDRWMMERIGYKAAD